MVKLNTPLHSKAQIVSLPSLLVFIIFKAELSDHDLDVRLGGRLQQLLQPHEAPVVLVEDGEALPAKTCYQIRESLAE